MILPELPSYLSNMGGDQYKGLIISLFTLTAALSRPFSGMLTDTIGRKPVMIFGFSICIVCSLFYPILSTVAGFLVLRLVHGMSTGFAPTAITTYVSDIVPSHRRGEAMGIIGVSMNLGASVSPPFGSYLHNNFGISTMFYASSAVAIISMILLFGISETLQKTKAYKWSMMRIKKNQIIHKDSIVPAIVCGLCYFGFGVIITITPDQCEHFNMTNKGLFFTSFTVCSILSRLVAGKVSDIYGRAIVMRVAIILLSIAYLVLGFAKDMWTLLFSTGFVGFSLGIAIPAIFAWTVDRCNDQNRGLGLATLFIGLEVAIGLGALIGAEIYSNQPSNFFYAFLVTSIICLAAIFFVTKKYTAPINSK